SARSPRGSLSQPSLLLRRRLSLLLSLRLRRLLLAAAASHCHRQSVLVVSVQRLRKLLLRSAIQSAWPRRRLPSAPLVKRRVALTIPSSSFAYCGFEGGGGA